MARITMWASIPAIVRLQSHIDKPMLTLLQTNLGNAMKQFSLRDLLFIVVIVSLLFGWWVDRQNRGPTSGRFQIRSATGHSVILDTATGQAWNRTYTDDGHIRIGFGQEFTDPKLPNKP